MARMVRLPVGCLRLLLFLHLGAPTTSYPFTPPPAKIANRLTLTAPLTAGRRVNFFEEFGVWKDAPVLTGSTKYEPLPDVKNIMITGGAGFMYVLSSPAPWAVPLFKSIRDSIEGALTLFLPLPSCHGLRCCRFLPSIRSAQRHCDVNNANAELLFLLVPAGSSATSPSPTPTRTTLSPLTSLTTAPRSTTPAP